MNFYGQKTQAEILNPDILKIPSFYRQIKNSLKKKRFPKNSFLRKPERSLFVDGGADGVAIYHTQVFSDDPGALPEILKRISAGDILAREALEDFFHEGTRLLYQIDNLWNIVEGSKEELDRDMLYSFSMQTLKESKSTECVKLALILLEILEAPDDPEVRDAVFTLGLSDEFTLYSHCVIRHWPDGNEMLFRLARLVRGWGKIFLVSELKVTTREIREWMLWNGWRNDILPSYSARKCAEEGGLLDLLKKRRLTAEEMELAYGLIHGLIYEGPMLNISVMEDGAEILLRYLTHIRAWGETDEEARGKLEQIL